MVRKFWITHFGMTDLSSREKVRTWVARALSVVAVVGVGAIAILSRHGRQPAEELVTLLMLVVMGMPLAWAFVTGFTRVRVGVDRVEVRHALGGITLNQHDIVRFRYVGRLPAPREWYIESARGLHPLGAGNATTMLVFRMLEQWPQIPKPSDAALSALGAADYRHESRDPHELAQLLRVPSLDSEARVRVATLLVQHGPEYRQHVDEVAEATLDPVARRRLRSL